MRILTDGDMIERNGFTFRVNILDDDNSDPPWNRADGHGPVTDWLRRSKGPGEWTLSTYSDKSRYYDAQEATATAKRDNWGLGEEALAELTQRLGKVPTRGEIRAEAVKRDFNFLSGWCNDQWGYIGIIVTHIPDDEESEDVKTDYSNALWGIESDAYEYREEVAFDLADEICATLHDEAAAVEHWAIQNVATLA